MEIEVVNGADLLSNPDKFETNILVDKFEEVNGEWTFEVKDGRWWTISSDPEKFLGDLVHMLQKNWFTARDAQVLIDWATINFNWNIHSSSSPCHRPYGLSAARRNPDNLEANQPRD